MNDLQVAQPLWRRLLSNHNPLYLISAWLVLRGIGQAFHGEVGLSWLPLMTPLLCGYTIAIALAGWLVVRVGKVWSDARMILLVVLLMFTALSTSYDNLCLKDPVSGAKHLAFGFAFCCAVTELILYLLGMKLPPRYRVPFYLQLAVLFVFPAALGKLSIAGRDPDMLRGVLLFPLTAAASLLTLIPAAASRQEDENGTPWPWPFYPWSIFIFAGIADGIRAWMLSVSFSPASGNDAGFSLYFLAPIVLALLMVALEMALEQRSRAAQGTALIGMLGVVWMAFPGTQLTGAQRLTVALIENSAAGPPLLICGAVSLIAIDAMLRRAAGAELVAVVSLVLLACLTPQTRSFETLQAPNEVALLAIAVWQLGYALATRSSIRYAVGGMVTVALIARQFNQPWLFQHNGYWIAQFTLLWFALVPLICRDAVAKWFRATGPFWLILAVIVGVPFAHSLWPTAPTWVPAATISAIGIIALIYLTIVRIRWYALAATFAGIVAVLLWSEVLLSLAPDRQLRNGLTIYACGCVVLAMALVVSLWNAALIHKCWNWLQGTPPHPRAPAGNN